MSVIRNHMQRPLLQTELFFMFVGWKIPGQGKRVSGPEWCHLKNFPERTTESAPHLRPHQPL